MSFGGELRELATEISEELIAEAMDAPFCLVKIRIWPWTIGGAQDERPAAVLETLAELGFAGCTATTPGRVGDEGELVIYTHIAMLDGGPAELHAELAKALREMTTWPVKVRSYWQPMTQWGAEHGDSPPGV